MGKNKGPDLPATPSFKDNPFFQSAISGLSGLGSALTQGRFLDSADPDVGFLNPLVSMQPEITKDAIGLATRDITERRDVAQQDIINQLAANNQLQSSVTGNRLADLNQSYSSDISDVSTQFRMADAERALGNIGGLFELGINTTGNVGTLGLASQQQQNTFNQQNYENQVAAALNSQKSGGGLMGAIGGGVGGASLGALAGLALAIPTGGLSIPAGLALGAGLGGIGGATMGGLSGDPMAGASFGGAMGTTASLAGAFQPTNTLQRGLTGNTQLPQQSLRFSNVFNSPKY